MFGEIIVKHLKDGQMEIRVKPNSKKTEIIEDENGVIVKIKSPADKNKANLEIIKLFSKLTKKRVSIVRGLKSKKKLLKFF